jgi:hypothetical protein
MIEVDATGNDAQGATILSSVPTIESEEQLNEILSNQQSEEGTPAQKQQPQNEQIESDNEDGLDDQYQQEATEYPTLLHYLDEKFQFGLNLQAVNELSKEQEAEALEGILERMTEGVNSKLDEYSEIEQMLQDPEIQEVLRAKMEGMSLVDMYNGFAASPDWMDDDTLAITDFRNRFPKSNDETIQSMVDSLKQTGQFENFVKSLREQLVEEQSLYQQQMEQQAQQEAEQQAIREQEEIQRYTEYLGNIDNVYGVPLNQEMKEAVFEITTVRDNQGMTALDHALQSDEGVILAALGVAFMKDLIQNSASINKNRARSRVMDKIFDTPEKLQSGTGRMDDSDPYDPGVLNRF